MTEIDWKGNTMLAWDHACKMQDCVVNLSAENVELERQLADEKGITDTAIRQMENVERQLAEAQGKLDAVEKWRYWHGVGGYKRSDMSALARILKGE